MRKTKSEREKLEGLMAEINAAYEAESDGQVCLSPLLGAAVDDPYGNDNTSEGDEPDELLS